MIGIISFVVWFFVWLCILSACFVILVWVRTRHRDDNTFILSTEKFPPNWRVGGMITVSFEEEEFNFKILEFVDETHVLVKEVV